MPAKKGDREQRLRLLRRFAVIGFTHETMANLLEVSLSTVRNELRTIPDLPKGITGISAKEREETVFRNALEEYAKLKLEIRGDSQRHLQRFDPMKVALRNTLGKWIGIKVLLAYITASETSMGLLLLPQFPPERKGYYYLLRRVFHHDDYKAWNLRERSPLSGGGEFTWLYYLKSLVEGTREWPTREGIWIDLAQFVVQSHRPNIAPIWSKAVYEEIDAAIECLTSKEQEIIIKFFALKEDTEPTLEDLGREYGTSRGRIQGIIEGGLKKLGLGYSGRKLERFLKPLPAIPAIEVPTLY